MNTLILTPDGVGSTILQRLLTMTLYLEKIKAVNVHEISNGNICLKNGVLWKNLPHDLSSKKAEDYSQKLLDIIELIQNSHKDTKIISKLAKYHLDNRQDSLSEQKIFFSFLNKFYEKKIMCVRKNIFEYGLSSSMLSGKVTNIYKKEDKKFIMEKLEVDENYFIKRLKLYVSYINWVEDNFPDVEKIFYEDIVLHSDYIIEKITGYKDTFVKNFDVNLSDILKMEYDFFNWSMKKNNEKKIFYTKKKLKGLILYKKLAKNLIKNEVILGLPIKSTTLEDKKKQIKNYDRCLDIFYSFAKNYNWIDQGIATYDFWNKKEC
jgi:hypothetical protein